MSDAGLYQKLGEVTESLVALNQRMERVERTVETEFKAQRKEIESELKEHRREIEKQLAEQKKDIESIKALPGRWLWAAGLAGAAGLGALVLRLIEGVRR